MKLSEILKIDNNKDRMDEVKQIRQNIVPFIGAGVSAVYGLPTWGDLLDELAEIYFEPNHRRGIEAKVDLIEYAQEIIEDREAEDVVDNIKMIYGDYNLQRSKMAYQLVDSFSGTLVTTNYDSIIESVAKKMPNRYALQVLLPEQKKKMTAAIQRNSRCILKMHGSLDFPQSIVLSKKQYDTTYGTNGNIDMQRPVPYFLSNIFSAKSVLFVGCSLEQDLTMCVMECCLGRNSDIRNFAIVEMMQDEKKQQEQKDRLDKLGILPIYYPQSDYKCVELILNYIAQDNAFTRTSREILSQYISNKDNVESIVAMLCESYYETAKRYPELLNVDEEISDKLDGFAVKIKEAEKDILRPYDLCVKMLELLSQACLIDEEKIKSRLIEQFCKTILREKNITSLLSHRVDGEKIEKIDLCNMSDDEITNLAKILNIKLQYENDRDYRDFFEIYIRSVDLLERACDRIDVKQCVLLCNSVGAQYFFFNDVEISLKYLNKAIEMIDCVENDEKDEKSLRVKSMCYCNMALIYAFAKGDYNRAIEYAKIDIKLKEANGVNKRLLAGSISHLALYRVESTPFLALSTFRKVIFLKRKNIEKADELRYERDKNETLDSMKKKLVASWASTVFDCGLYARDLGFYELACQFVEIADKFRKLTICEYNPDYVATINVKSELSIHLNHNENLQNLIDGIIRKTEINQGITKELFYSYYVCALYFQNIDKGIAMQYIRKFKQNYALAQNKKDVRLEVNVELLAAQISENSRKKLLDDARKKIEQAYGENSFWMLQVYKRYAESEDIYRTKLEELQAKYDNKLKRVAIELEQLYIDIKADMPKLSEKEEQNH